MTGLAQQYWTLIVFAKKKKKQPLVGHSWVVDVFNGWCVDSGKFDSVGCGDQGLEYLDTWIHVDWHTSNIYSPASTRKHTNAYLDASALHIAP